MTAGDWLLPRLAGLTTSTEAIDHVIRVLRMPSPDPAVTQGSSGGPPANDAPLDERVEMIVALVRLAAVLARFIEASTTLDGVDLLEVIRKHQHARADLEALDQLDDGPPFR